MKNKKRKRNKATRRVNGLKQSNGKITETGYNPDEEVFRAGNSIPIKSAMTGDTYMVTIAKVKKTVL